MPAMPIADSSAPIVVGISATSSAISVVIETSVFANSANGLSATTTTRKISVSPASRMFERDLVRRLAPLGALDQRDHAVQEALAGLLRDLDHDPVGEHARAAGDRAAVAAGLADHRRRLAGDRGLVDGGDALDHGAVAGDHLAGLDDHDVAALQLGGGALAAVAPGARWSRCASRAARPPGPCRGPRPAPRRGCEDDGQPQPERDGEREPGGLVAAAERLPPKSWISHAIVVISAPTSTTNMTGLRTWTRGSSLRERRRRAPAAGSRAVEQRAGAVCGHRGHGPPRRARG